MAACTVKINGIESAKKFVEMLKFADGDFELVSGKYIINARSIMGIFCLDLTKPMILRSPNAEIPEAVEPFLA